MSLCIPPMVALLCLSGLAPGQAPPGLETFDEATTASTFCSSGMLPAGWTNQGGVDWLESPAGTVVAYRSLSHIVYPATPTPGGGGPAAGANQVDIREGMAHQQGGTVVPTSDLALALVGTTAVFSIVGSPARAFLGISSGNLGATDPGTTLFTPGGAGVPTSGTAMIYGFFDSGAGGGNLPPSLVPGTVSTLVFNPSATQAPNYDWSAY